MRGNRLDPQTRGEIWYEDYMELHDVCLMAHCRGLHNPLRGE